MKRHALKRYTVRLLTALTAAAAGVSVLPAVRAAAATETVVAGIYGDLNGDQKIDLPDVRLMQAFLNGDLPAFGETDPKYADIDHSGTVNAADFTLLKRLILTDAQPEIVYQEIEVPDPPLMDPPIAVLNPSLPSAGTARVLMFAVGFSDCQIQDGYSADRIYEMTFGPENPNERSYPMESINAYYERASYGRLHLDGDVYICNLSNEIDNYIGDREMLVDAVLETMDQELDYSRYDADADGRIDTMILALPKAAAGRDHNNDGTEDWWPSSNGYFGRRIFDGMKPGNNIIGAWDLNDRAGFTSTWAHELGHAMGLPDYYKYELNGDEGYYGMNGSTGWDLMDDAYGDLSAFSKLMLGWYREDEVQVYTHGTQTFTLQSSQHAPGCILIPRTAVQNPSDAMNNLYSEYFLIEYNTADRNNAGFFSGGSRYPLFQKPGVRVLHCDAELWNGYWGKELKWNNYGMMYDSSNQRQRVIRTAMENQDYVTAGKSVSFEQYPEFAWYDTSGYRSIDPNIIIHVDSIRDGICTVTISEKS